MVAPKSPGRSAKVRLELNASGRRFQLAQFGGDVLIFTKKVILPGSAGEVVARIDDQVQRWAVTWVASDIPREIIPSRSDAIE